MWECINKCEVYNEDFDKKLDEKIEKSSFSSPDKGNWGVLEYIIEIPKWAKKQDLVDLKVFLNNQKSWKIEIFIKLQWQKISTKISIWEIWELKEWIRKKWG